MNNRSSEEIETEGASATSGKNDSDNSTSLAHSKNDSDNSTSLAKKESVNSTTLVAMDFVKQYVEIDAKQDELDHAEEMAQADKDAEEEVEKHADQNEDEQFAFIEA